MIKIREGKLHESIYKTLIQPVTLDVKEPKLPLRSIRKQITKLVRSWDIHRSELRLKLGKPVYMKPDKPNRVDQNYFLLPVGKSADSLNNIYFSKGLQYIHAKRSDLGITSLAIDITFLETKVKMETLLETILKLFSDSGLDIEIYISDLEANDKLLKKLKRKYKIAVEEKK